MHDRKEHDVEKMQDNQNDVESFQPGGLGHGPHQAVVEDGLVRESHTGEPEVVLPASEDKPKHSTIESLSNDDKSKDLKSQKKPRK